MPTPISPRLADMMSHLTGFQAAELGSRHKEARIPGCAHCQGATCCQPRDAKKLLTLFAGPPVDAQSLKGVCLRFTTPVDRHDGRRPGAKAHILAMAKAQFNQSRRCSWMVKSDSSESGFQSAKEPFVGDRVNHPKHALDATAYPATNERFPGPTGAARSLWAQSHAFRTRSCSFGVHRPSPKVAPKA